MLLLALRPIPGPIQTLPGQTFYELSDTQREHWISGGFARPLDMAVADDDARPAPATVAPPALRNGVPNWTGMTVAILASGPSLTAEQCEAVGQWRAAGADRRVIAINTTFRRAPFADMVYACDGTYWRAKALGAAQSHVQEAVAAFGTGKIWTQDVNAAKEFGLNLIRSEPGQGLSRKAGVINQGMNSGYQAINIAFLGGARRMLLLGFDCKGGHWHGDHPAPLSNRLPHKQWLDRFVRLARDLQSEGITVVNCSPGTALHTFPEQPLERELAK